MRRLKLELTQAYSLNFSTVPVPEPAAAWLLLAGLVVLRLVRRHRAAAPGSMG